MYRERIDEQMARSILGEDFRPDKQYYLLSDRDKFVVAVYNDAGTRLAEYPLQQDRVDGAFMEDDDLPTVAEHKRVHSVNVGSVITFLMVAISLVAVIGVMLIMMYRR